MEIHKRKKTAVIRAAAKDLVKCSAANGNPLTHCAALEILAKEAGYRSYQAYSASVVSAPAIAVGPEPAKDPKSAQAVSVVESNSVRPTVTDRQVMQGMHIVLHEAKLKVRIEENLENGETSANDGVVWDIRRSIRELRGELASAGALHAVDIARERRAASDASTLLVKQTGVIPDYYICVGGNCRIYLRLVASHGGPRFLTLTRWDEWAVMGNDGDDNYQIYDAAYQRAQFTAWCEGCAFLPNTN